MPRVFFTAGDLGLDADLSCMDGCKSEGTVFTSVSLLKIALKFLTSEPGPFY